MVNIFFRAFCRTFQQTMRVACNFLDFSEPKVLDGLDKIPKVLSEKGVSSVLIVTDELLHQKLRLLDGLKASLEAAGIKCAVYDKTVPNPTVDNIEEAYKMHQENGCGAIIAFGGGSPMDCAKGAACRVNRPKKTVKQMKGLLKIRKKYKNFFAVPTTSGTGSEATVAAVVKNPVTHEKYAINDPALIPSYAVLEPALTVALPKHITSTTGMDALTHAVESFIGSENTKKTKSMAIAATKLIFENIQKVFDDGTDIAARKTMQLAAFYAGVAFTRAYVGNVHAVAHALGGFYGTPHGLANAVILPRMLDFYGAKAHKKLARLATAAGVVTSGTTEERAKEFIAKIKELNAYMGIPETVQGIKEEDIREMAKRASAEANPLYPVPVIMSKKDIAAFILGLKAQ